MIIKLDKKHHIKTKNNECDEQEKNDKLNRCIFFTSNKGNVYKATSRSYIPHSYLLGHFLWHYQYVISDVISLQSLDKFSQMLKWHMNF
jgi:hypothetical protein